MADSTKTDTPANNGEGSSKAVRAGGWTEGERLQLLLRIIASILPDGKGVEWKKIEMEGRTLKAMQGQWTAIQAQIRDLNINSDSPATPAKPRAPRKKTPKKAAKSDGDEDANDDEGAEEADTPKKPVTPRKRGAAATATDGSAKKRRGGKKAAAKAEEDDEQEKEEKTDEKVKPEENADEKEQ
ncbi:hypothetical protein CkaCkLH20_00953 [Colletotrichum karsti]|uniref:Uncharacterized protein n=1 Tax=Colletotrichum karsti TaxID=1095194 RepID=A0A9P6LR38_9PEZI|nr:uncharacterized protein CkaCkLH20_00953 [Colletotrichum karsti]KAF9881807.1 hypothetical protein CkaCkLH20_00953 [Colletotrichum karsti]